MKSSAHEPWSGPVGAAVTVPTMARIDHCDLHRVTSHRWLIDSLAGEPAYESTERAVVIRLGPFLRQRALQQLPSGHAASPIAREIRITRPELAVGVRELLLNPGRLIDGGTSPGTPTTSSL